MRKYQGRASPPEPASSLMMPRYVQGPVALGHRRLKIIDLSERAAQLIQEDMQYMGPVRVSDVEAAQQKIVDVVRRLEDAGEIIIAGRGGEKEMVV